MTAHEVTGGSTKVALPTFAEFYAEVHDRTPLPWQQRLASQAADAGWPDEIGVPTGLGKTGCLDIAVWALAAQADRPAPLRTAPTRVWYVVDRRLLVDGAYDHGIRLRDLLSDARSGPLAAVAQRLRRIAGGTPQSAPLHVTRLRGSAALGARPPHPAQPTLCFATVAMYGSRLLFRGYGTSTSMRPVDAALAGIDSLVLLDEAHLAPALIGLSEPIVQCDLGQPERVIGAERSRPRFVALTATGRTHDSQRFDLDDADHRHHIVQRRLTASKPTRLVETKRRSLAGKLAEQVLAGIDAAGRPVTCLVFVNTTKLAGEVADKLRKKLDDVLVLTGRLRSREAGSVRQRLLADDGLRAGRPLQERFEPLVVVATQTLEVGADLDADLLVTQSAGVRALVQRFGRLNRLGERPEARGVIVHAADEQSTPVYGEEAAALWDRLRERCDDDGGVDLAPGRIAEVFGIPSDRPRRAGELLPIHLWEWAKTTLAPHGEAPPELFFAGIDEDPARVAVAWRAWLPEPGERCLPPVRQEETVEVSISVARRLLESRAGTADARRLAADRSTVDNVDHEAVGPGDTVLLAVDAGGYDPVLGLDPDAELTVFDVSVLTASMLPLNKEVIRHLLPDVPAGELTACFRAVTDRLASDEQPQIDDWELVRHELVSLMASHRPNPAIGDDEWCALLSHITDGRLDLPQPGSTPVVSWSQSRAGTDTPVASDVFDDLSFDASSVALDEHLASVGEIAARLATTVGLAQPLIESLRIAGQLHDIGKADVRFQRWLAPEGSGQPLAKSEGTRRETRRQAAGWPRGGRHECLSARLLDAAIDAGGLLPQQVSADLVRHLVISHHGHGRPSVPVVDDTLPTTVHSTVLGHEVTVDGDLAVEELDQPARFRSLNRVYGYWGLALLEALLRQADHIASRTTEVA